MQHGKESSQIEYPRTPQIPGFAKIPQSNQYPAMVPWHQWIDWVGLEKIGLAGRAAAYTFRKLWLPAPLFKQCIFHTQTLFNESCGNPIVTQLLVYHMHMHTNCTWPTCVHEDAGLLGRSSLAMECILPWCGARSLCMWHAQD